MKGNGDLAIYDYFSCVELTADFSVIQCILQDDHHWAAKVLELAGDLPDYCDHVRRRNNVETSRIIPVSPDTFIALGPIGLTRRLSFEVKRVNQTEIEVKPIPYLEIESKIGILLFLTLFCVFPACFSPFVWEKSQRFNLLLSKYYLQAFAKYVLNSYQP